MMINAGESNTDRYGIEKVNCDETLPNSRLTGLEPPVISSPYDSDTDSEHFGYSSSDENVSEKHSRTRITVKDAMPINPPHLQFSFTGNNEINYDFDEVGNILQYFESFFDDDVVNMIVEETNRNAELKLRLKNIRKKWERVTSDELRVFLAVQILKGIVKKEDERMYWSKNPTIATPFFAKAITYQRFSLIKQYLRFASNEDFDLHTHPHAKLCKIWPFYEKMVAKFQTNYTPEKFVTIEENLAVYKEQAGWLQYESFEKTPTIIKYFMLCESKSGYVWRFLIHTGRATSFDSEYKDLPTSAQVVMTLMKPLLNKGYCLSLDDNYTSPQLSERLSSNETDIYGIGKVGRKASSKINERKFKRIARGNAGTIQGKKSLLSPTHHDEIAIGIDKQTTFDNENGEQLLVTNHSSPIKRGKLYCKKIFFHIVEMALWNSFILYRKSGGKDSALNYRVDLIECIMKKYHSPLQSTKAGWPGNSSRPLRLTERHFPDTIPRTEKKANPTRICVVCSRKRDTRGHRVRRESRYQCSDCEVGLCVSPCFKIYHTSGND